MEKKEKSFGLIAITALALGVDSIISRKQKTLDDTIQ